MDWPRAGALRAACVVVAVAALAGVPSGGWAHVGVDELDALSHANLAANPESAEAHVARARVLALKGEWDAALEQLEEAVAHGADRDVVGRTRSAVYLEAGFPRMAKVEIERVLARRPDAWDLRWDRGRAWLALRNAEAAARDFGDAIARGSRPTPEQVMARRDALLSLGRTEEALRALDEGMARVGRVVSLQLPAVDLELQLGRYEAALARLEELARGAPPNPLWVARRGDVLAKAGRAADARAQYTKALAMIEERPPNRRGTPLADLERRLKTALAPADQQRGER